MAGRRASRARHVPPRARNRHFLRPALAAAIVADACVGSDELVLDIGAGFGRLTHELAGTGARVVAIELDPTNVAALRRRFGSVANVEVVEADALRLPLPRQPFRVVANLPFGSGTAILRRLLGSPALPLTCADVIVEWDLARKRAASWPSTLLGVTWSAWYALSVIRRLPRACFEPAPSVDAAVLRATRRDPPLVPVAEARDFRAFVRHSFERGLPRSRAARRTLRGLGLSPSAPPRELDVHQWAALHTSVRRSGYSAAARKRL